MEPSDFDRFIKNKLQESTDLHKQDRDAAKPFIWSAIQSGALNRSLNWRHLAAAILLLLIGFSLVLHMKSITHQRELDHLNEKLGALQERYQSQQVQFEEKYHQVDDSQITSIPFKERIIYKFDTIYEVDTVVVRLKEFIPVAHPVTKQVDLKPTENTLENPVSEVDELIYPNYTDQGVKRKPETIQFKFGSFTARKD